MKFFKKIMCYFKGCDYPADYYDNFTLCFCHRCHKEILDRTFDDIDPVPEDYDLHDALMLNGEIE